MNIEKNKGIDTRKIFELFICVFYTWYFLPICNVLFGTNTHKLLFFGCFFVGILGLLVKNGFRANGVVVAVLSYMILFALLFVLKVGDASAHIRVSFIFWGAALLSFGVLDEGGKRRVGWYILALFLVTFITSSVGVISDNEAARTIAHAAADDTLQNAYKMKNISSIYLFQCMVCLVPVLICFPKTVKQKIFCLAALVFIFVVLMNASFTISLIVFFLAIGIALIQKWRGAVRWIVTFLVGWITVYLLFNAGEILLFLSDAIENDKISTRLLELATGFSTGNLTGDAGMRWEIYEASIRTFFEHPFGVGVNYSYIPFDQGIGHHSQLLDDLARYGVAALAFYIVFLLSYYKYLKKSWSEVGCPQVAGAVTAIYTVFLVLNLGFRSADESVVMLILLPILPVLLKGRKSRTKENVSERRENNL